MKKKYIILGIVAVVLALSVVCILWKCTSDQKTDDKINIEGNVDEEDGETPVLPAQTPEASDDKDTATENSEVENSKNEDSKTEASAKEDTKTEETQDEDVEKKDTDEGTDEENSDTSDSKGDGTIELPFVPYN